MRLLFQPPFGPARRANLVTESGFIVFNVHEVQLSRPNVQVEVLMDDYMFPAYSSPKIRTKSARIDDGMYPGEDIVDVERANETQ